MGRASAFRPRDSRRYLHPTPTASTLQPRGAGGGRRRVLRPPLGEPAPVAGTRGSGSPAPAAPPPLAPARAPFATQIAQGLAPAAQPGAAPGAEPFENGRGLRRRRAPGVTRGGGRPGRWGRATSGGRPGGPCPGPAARAGLGGRQSPCCSSSSSNRVRASRLGAATTSPHPVPEGNFRPQPRWPPGPAPWASPAVPAVPALPAAPRPGRPRLPLTWPAACQAPSPREAYGHPHRGPCPLSCAGAAIPPGRRLPRLSPGLPRWRGEGCPCCGRWEVPTGGGGGRGTSRPGHPSRWDSDSSNDSRIWRLSFNDGFAKCFHPQESPLGL